MRKKLKILFILILLLVLIAGGFALGVYLRLFDTKELNKQYGLHELPIVGEYFVPPAAEEHSATEATTSSLLRGLPHQLQRRRRRLLRM